MLSLLNYLLFSSLFLVARAQHVQLVKQTIPIETSQLRQFESKFIHHAQAFAALAAGENHFEVSETNRSTEGWNFSK